MISKAIMVVLALLSLLFAGWAGSIAFADPSAPISSVAMMGMMGYVFHAAVILASLWFPIAIRRRLTLLLLAWHIPETLLIATMGMGVDSRPVGIAIHGTFSALALLSWYLAKPAGAVGDAQQLHPAT